MNQLKNIRLLMKKFNLEKKYENLIKQSFHHSSYSNEIKRDIESNERLEFLGDNVLNLIISEYLYKKYPLLQEGDLSKKRAQLICEEALCVYAKEINLSECLFLGKGEEKNGGRNRNLIIADAFEAFIGAIFLSYGFDKAKDILTKILFPVYKNNKINIDLVTDYKTAFQEIVSSNFKKKVLYKVTKEEGLPHNKVFTIVAIVDNKIYGIGSGNSKKEAEQKAAYCSIKKIAKICK